MLDEVDIVFIRGTSVNRELLLHYKRNDTGTNKNRTPKIQKKTHLHAEDAVHELSLHNHLTSLREEHIVGLSPGEIELDHAAKVLEEPRAFFRLGQHAEQHTSADASQQRLNGGELLKRKALKKRYRESKEFYCCFSSVAITVGAVHTLKNVPKIIITRTSCTALSLLAPLRPGAALPRPFRVNSSERNRRCWVKSKRSRYMAARDSAVPSNWYLGVGVLTMIQWKR